MVRLGSYSRGRLGWLGRTGLAHRRVQADIGAKYPGRPRGPERLSATVHLVPVQEVIRVVLLAGQPKRGNAAHSKRFAKSGARPGLAKRLECGAFRRFWY